MAIFQKTWCMKLYIILMQATRPAKLRRPPKKSMLQKMRHASPTKITLDDSTVVLMPLKKGVGGLESGPIVLFLADGMGKHGQECSREAVNNFSYNQYRC